MAADFHSFRTHRRSGSEIVIDVNPHDSSALKTAVRRTVNCVLYKPAVELYTAAMATFNVSKARENLSEAVELSQTEAVFLERHGSRAAVLVSPERYEEMMAALEDVEDVAAFDSAMAEEGPNIPWDEVKADLGWD